MPSQEKIREAINYIRTNASQSYQNTVPALASTDTIEKIGFVLDSQDLLTEFTNGLVNRIIKVMVEKKSFNNPLSIFKKGNNPVGSDIQHMFTNPAKGKQYSLSQAEMSKLLTYNESDDKIVYYRRNRRDLYEVSIPEYELRPAFTSLEKLGELIQNKVNSLTNGNTIDEFNYIKNMISKAVTNATIQMVQVPRPVDESTAKAFVKTVKKLHGKFLFPSTKYNSYGLLHPNDTPVMTNSREEAICLIIDTDSIAEIDVELLADAFNMQKAEIASRLVKIDEYSNENLVGLLCDDSFLQIYDNLFIFRNFYNGRALVYNYYVHAWSTYALSPFANAVALVTSKANVAPTGVTVKTTELNLKVGDNFGIQAKVEPVNATDKGINYVSSDDNIVTVNNNGYLTALSTGVATITVTSNLEGDTGVTISVNVS